MVKLLEEVVCNGRREKEELHRKISMFEGQLQQLLKVCGSRKKAVQCS